MHRSHRRARIAATLVATAVVASGCFGSSSGGSTDSGKGALVEDDGPPQSGGTFQVAGTADAPSLDPQKEPAYSVHSAVGAVYSRLLAFKTGQDIDYGTNEVEGDLAEEWKSSDDAKTWTVTLREGVVWHDKAPVNGRELTVDDVVCTFDRIKEIQGHALGLISNVESLTTPDERTLVFQLKTPYSAFDETLANPFLAILPCEATNGGFDPATEAIGTGPFVLDSWKRNQERVYLKNQDYFVEGQPYLDGYTTTIMPDAQAQIAALRSGKIDMITTLSTEKRQVDQLLSQVKGLQKSQEAGTTQTRVYMNADKKPFDKVEVRRAVALAIDKQGMIDGIRAGGTVTGPITPSLFGALPTDEVEKLVPYDPDEAKRLLKKAGFPDGFSAKMVVTTGYGETIVREAQWVQEDLAKVGIKVELEVQDYATYAGDTWPNGKYDIGYGLQTPMLTANEYLSTEYHSQGSRNWSNVDDPELDAMIDAQKAMSDADQREKALQEIDRHILEKVLTPLPLYVYDGQTLLSPRVRSWNPHPDYSAREYQDIWLKQD
ncbi:ABC transporter substrate-binding protein [Aeromicrobium duanguangcaii]|uniref:ABC transporter substrate-binding protein n=1 Tax=Aeromicrobium duanguangcaii TaxID=2968086 RepID=UPI0020182BF9|nr:ABC transporter substrate-binding protein [Aeromicrobium duanguangcaii]MCL3838252.1 ABC transporter substrate-binding protein [Aeromicrobium duanguangcaii]